MLLNEGLILGARVCRLGVTFYVRTRSLSEVCRGAARGGQMR